MTSDYLTNAINTYNKL